MSQARNVTSTFCPNSAPATFSVKILSANNHLDAGKRDYMYQCQKKMCTSSSRPAQTIKKERNNFLFNINNHQPSSTNARIFKTCCFRCLQVQFLPPHPAGWLGSSPPLNWSWPHPHLPRGGGKNDPSWLCRNWIRRKRCEDPQQNWSSSTFSRSFRDLVGEPVGVW